MTCRMMATVVILLEINTGFAADETITTKPVPKEQATAHMQLPEGFQATLFAGEPDIVQPIAFTIDDRGRLWVVECLSYPAWTKNGKGNDRIVIFTDSNGDGKFDSRKVFYDQGANLSGIALGFGGVWLNSTPNFLFIPDANGDDVPDGEPQILLDGWDLSAKHNVTNGLTWGPDGWLYAANGILSNSKVGKPGTPDAQRVAMNCGIWRYHPTRHEFEVVAHGTTNPWGIDFDQYGQMFLTNCVIKHLFHVIPGGHYERMFGQDLTPNVYGLLASCADHIHWGGGKWTTSRGGEGVHDKPGGGHAHSGAMIYLGDNWPDAYRHRLFTCNIHGTRINQDLLEPHGSGYVAKHGKDFLHSQDEWFRGLELKYGPDGGVYVTDWTDAGECHDYKHIDREHGRIYKITYGETQHVPVDLAKATDAELIAYQDHKNEWYVRHARRLLQERAATGKLASTTEAELRKRLDSRPKAIGRLRSLWCLHAISALTDDDTIKLLKDDNEHLRGWAIQLALEDRKVAPEILVILEEIAKSEDALSVRLFLASALQRLPLDQRWTVARELISRQKDMTDDNLPLMYWYGIEPLIQHNRRQALRLAVSCQIPIVRQHIARRLAETAE